MLPPLLSPCRLVGVLLVSIGSGLVALAPVGAADPAAALFTIAALHARVAAAPPGAKEAAAFMVLVNDGERPVRLVGGSSPAAGEIVLMVARQVVREGRTVLVAKPVPAIEVPAHGRRELKPGGDHLLLMNLKGTPKEGDLIFLTMRFEDPTGRTQYSLVAPVAPVGEGDPRPNPSPSPAPTP